MVQFHSLLTTPGKVRAQVELTRLAQRLGELHGSLLSLELVLRAFLLNYQFAFSQPGGVAAVFPELAKLETLQADDWVTENPFTNWDSLGDVIQRYNCATASLAPRVRIDPGLNDLRDVLAHGRLFAGSAEGAFQLVKFGRPQGGRVRVLCSISLTDSWFKEHIRSVNTALQTANQVNDRLMNGTLK